MNIQVSLAAHLNEMRSSKENVLFVTWFPYTLLRMQWPLVKMLPRLGLLFSTWDDAIWPSHKKYEYITFKYRM